MENYLASKLSLADVNALIDKGERFNIVTEEESNDGLADISEDGEEEYS